jgi:hypothetical protein
MRRWTKQLGAVVGVAVAAAVLAFGTHAAYATARSSDCDPGDPGYVGECPPWDPILCESYCQGTFKAPSNGCHGDCCICAYR